MTLAGHDATVSGMHDSPHRAADSSLPIHRTEIVLHPDLGRVILRPHLPDEDIFPDGGLLKRILDLSEDEVEWILTNALARFTGRHHDIEASLERHFEFVANEATRVDAEDSQLLGDASRARRLLIGAYFTGEYSIEAASLTNPSIVQAPDQSGLEPGALRFVLSIRGIGEGHLSSIEFRSGVIDATGHISIEEPSSDAMIGTHTSAIFEKSSFGRMLREMNAYDEVAESILDGLTDPFELDQLDKAITTYEDVTAPRHLTLSACQAMHSLGTSNYVLTFPPTSALSERVMFPASAVEREGMEDARFVRFVDEDGAVTYYATYTAYSGSNILPQLIETKDFHAFETYTLSGICAHNKGAALFPRRIDGQYAALSRYDGENNYVMQSDNLRIWDGAQLIESPEASWDLARIGNCGSPIETEAGWLVITHGVGPFRTYSLGAILLDIDDPTRLLGRLDEPLLSPIEEQREGYVPNVVYSCGSMVHDGTLVVPFGISDRSSGIATVPLDSLLEKLT